MKINNKILSLPPHLSTSWSQVKSLRIDSANLVVHLVDGATVCIPDLDDATLSHIFTTHAAVIEQQGVPSAGIVSKIFSPIGMMQEQRLDVPFRFAMSGLDEAGSLFHHNAAQAGIPEIPSEILQKIVAITKVVIPEGVSFPKPEQHCNCVHCQVGKAIFHSSPIQEVEMAPLVEEEISSEELSFQQWEIVQTGENLYQVVNRLDRADSYRVYLGDTIGCTCGKDGCEHVIAVLKS